MIKRPEKSENRHPFRLESPEKDADFCIIFSPGYFATGYCQELCANLLWYLVEIYYRGAA